MSEMPREMTVIKIPGAPSMTIEFPEYVSAMTVIYQVIVIPKANVKKVRIKLR
jgi:hypothetical protein